MLRCVRMRMTSEVKDILVNEIGISETDICCKEIDEGLSRVSRLYEIPTNRDSENFRKLMLAEAGDVRVIMVLLAERLVLMRQLNHCSDEEQRYRMEIAEETASLYAPLAHRLGLYAIKTELEDLSLKFRNYIIYKEIATALNEKKAQRDAYIDSFITPLKEKLTNLGFTFSIKGRTKSIHSIYKKMLNQNCGVDHIYDLFAIRIILDSPIEKEKSDCWQVYSFITDMYQPNPKRLRDWLSVPKPNGYESLHTTVLGPEDKWVEVQIRTKRMDEIAEKGVAAHYRYKGVKGDFMDVNDNAIYVFTPNGDLHQLPKGSTVLDFAFSIHSNLGCRCVGAKLQGHNVPIKHELHNADQVEILTSNTQKPSEAWLHIVKTTKAKNKIRQSLKEIEFKDAAEGRELLERRFKNWKIEYEESHVARLAKKLGYKSVSDFYQALAQGKEDILNIKDVYQELDKPIEQTEQHSANEFTIQETPIDTANNNADILVIDKDLRGVDYKLAKCCNPIYGDRIFGFVSVSNGIRIHRCDCPNAADMYKRFPYRVIKARWSGKSVGQQFPVTFQVVGNDDIGIVTNISSLINKENGVLLRTISIDSHDGLFEGHLTLMVSNTDQLEVIQKKIATVKGVKSVTRL